MLTLRPSTADDLVRVLAIESAPDTAKWLGQTGWAWHDQRAPIQTRSIW